jgi:putative peptide zinc metalloprotease protein
MNSYFLTSQLSITVTDDPAADRRYCVVWGDRAFHVSQRLASLLEVMRSESSLQRITERLNAAGGTPLNEEQVRQVIEGQLMPSGLVSVDPGGAAAAPASQGYLFFARTLIGRERVLKLSAPLSALASLRVALPLAGLAVALLGWWLYSLALSGLSFSNALASLDLTLAEAIGFYLLLALSLLCHELGHAAVSYRNGARPAEIGFGLYLIFPAFFCNVTEAWRLPRAQRLAINLGGVYFQLLATAAITPFAVLTHSDVLDLLIASNLMSMLITLNPFFRFDGYWVYSDLFRLPNLRDQARACTTALIGRVMRGDTPAAGRPQPAAPLALRGYALASAIFFTCFTVTTAVAVGRLLTQVPAMAAATARQLAGGAGAQTWAAVLGGAAMLLLYLLACLLSLQFVVLRLRGVWQLIEEGKKPSATARVKETV